MEYSLKQTAKQLATISKTMTAAFTAPVIALGALSLKTVQYGAEIATTAQKVNMTAESLQRWNHIAKQTNVEADTLTKGFVKFRSVVGDVMLGRVSTQSKALQELGMSMNDIKYKSPEQTFEILIKKLSGIKDSTLQAKYAGDVFGDKIANDLIPLFQAGENAINEYSKEFEQIGYLTNEQVKKLSDFDNKMNRVKATLSVVGAELGTSFLPILEQLMMILENSIIPLMKTLSQLFNALPAPIQTVVTAFALLLAAIGPLIWVYQKLILFKIALIPLYKKAVAVKVLSASATSQETAQEIANNAAKNATFLTMIKSIATYATHKLAVVASTVVTHAYAAATWVATAATWALNAALAVNPFVWIVAGIIALVAVFVLLWTKCEGFRTFWQNLWEVIVVGFKLAVNGIISMINGFLNVLKTMINGIIGMANGLLNGLNKLPGVNIKLIPKIPDDAIQIPKFANGGIVYGETIGMMGEYSGVKNNPEIIAPLDKLKDIIGEDSSGGYTIIVQMDSEVLAKHTIKRLGKNTKLITS